jgi:hypothetical protein
MSTMQVVTKAPIPPAAKMRRPPVWWGVEELKPERIQEALQVRLSRREAADLLPLVPGWQLAANGKAVERAREFATQEVAALFGAFVTGFAGALGISAAVNVAGPQAVVRLYSRRSQGRMAALSEGILGFAKLLG